MKLDLIHQDDRGEIYTFGDGIELCNMLFTNAGKARGGCMHIEDEHLIVLKGEIELFLFDNSRFMGAGDCITIPNTTPHYFVSKTDSIVSESGAKGEILGKWQLHLDKIDDINSAN